MNLHVTKIKPREKMETLNFYKFLIYLLISILATTIDLGVFLILVDFGLFIIIANTISLSLGIFVKFSLNRVLTFKSRRNHHWKTQFKRFITVSGSGLVLSNISLYIILSGGLLNVFWSKIVVIGIIFIYTIVLHNFYSFQKNKEVM